MSKTRVTSRKFNVVDLVRDKPATTYVEIPVWRVDVQIDVTTTGLISASDVPKAKLDRLEESARKALDVYEEVIGKEAARLDAKIVSLAKAPDAASQAAAAKMLDETNRTIVKALAGAEGAAKEAVAARLAKEAQGDKNLTEARVATSVNVAKAALSLTTAVARLVPAAGVDVTAWLQLANALYDIGVEVREQLKSEDTLRQEFQKAAKTFVESRAAAITQAASRQGLPNASRLSVDDPAKALVQVASLVKAAGETVLKGRKPAEVLGEVTSFVEKGVHAHLDKVENARTRYRENTTKMRHATDSLSTQADRLMKEVRAAKGLKEGVKVGAACMALMHDVRKMADKLDQQEKFLDATQGLLAAHGMKIDDRTTLDKIQQCDLSTTVQVAEGIYKGAMQVKELVTALA